MISLPDPHMLIDDRSVPDGPPAARLRVLLLTADRAATQTLCWAIESLGDVVEVCGAAQALSVAYAFRPDVIIADTVALGAAVPQFCQDLHAIQEISNTKVIVQGECGVDLGDGNIASKFDLRLKKPIDLVVLADMLFLLRTSRKLAS